MHDIGKKLATFCIRSPPLMIEEQIVHKCCQAIVESLLSIHSLNSIAAGVR